MLARLIFFTLIHGILSAYPASLSVWSLGFCEYADVKPVEREFEGWMGFSDDRYLFDKHHYLREIKEGSIVWIKADWLYAFVAKVLPQLKHKIILVAGTSDATFPDNYPEKEEIIEAINSPKILHLFLQNCNFSHPKVTQIPIGIDLHTSVYWPERYRSPTKMTPELQQRELNQIIQHLKPTGERELKALCDFAFNDSMRNSYHRYLEWGEDRETIWEKIKPLGFAIHLKKMIPRSELWKLKGEYAFDISPPGNGIDCHRTWESLTLGCIVIVKDSFLNPLYEGLPVVIVKSWEEITEANLIRWRNQYKDALTNPNYRKKLLLSYWMDKIRAVQQSYLTTTNGTGLTRSRA